MNHSEPWRVLGDFNSIISVEERMGGNTPTSAEIEDFLACTTTLALEDDASVGNQYTLSNGTVWSKLDRVLLNPDWFT